MQTHRQRPLIRLALFLALSGTAIAQFTGFAAPVIAISDGDTIRVLA
jgi:hypothetical protein